MTTDIVLAAAGHLTPAQVEVVRRSIAVGATDEELALFLATAARLRLDPFAGQIYFVKRRQRDPQDPDRWISVGTAQVGIKGLRRIAARSGRLGGIRRGIVRDGNRLVSGWAEVHRTDWPQPVREEVDFEEVCQRNQRGDLQGLWKSRPAMMLKKAAERAALEVAFPVGDELEEEPEAVAHADAYELPDGRQFDPVTGEIADHALEEDDEGDLAEEPGDAGWSAGSSALEPVSTPGSSDPSEADQSQGPLLSASDDPTEESPGGAPSLAAGDRAEGAGAGTRPPAPPARLDDDALAPEQQWERAAAVFGSVPDALRALSKSLGRTVSQKNVTRGELAAVITERLGVG